ncbi:MAG: flavin-containing monooxygenase [Gammaproteobacteria bacterium]
MAVRIQDLTAPERLGFDPDALREKYREERDKRLREDANDQYVEVSGDFSHYVDDPYVERIEREPVEVDCEALVIGGGFGGLLAAARLKESGVTDLCIIEQGGDFGGTWYWNRYPGAQCDIESYIYLPLLEEVGYVPKEKYSHAPEILEYASKIATHYGLYEQALLQTGVSGMRWDEDKKRWIVTTDRGDTITARFVAMSNGPLNRPKLPGIPGIDSFEGHTFHTSRWDYDYTGGGPEGGLDRLGDKRVGIIGTGATAIQCVPHLGAAAKELYVFQRTPSSVDVRANRPTDPDWAKSLEPGWQEARMDNFNAWVSGVPQDEDLVADGWTRIFRDVSGMIPPEGCEELPPDELALATEIADFRQMNTVRDRIETIVEDEATAESLKPWYRQFCKRPCFHDEYLDTFNRPNVTLVDTGGQGVERITPKGVVVDGKEYELDCLVFATGFEVGTGYARRAGYDVVGRDGVHLAEKWASGPLTFHGLHSRGFPNCFFMGITQTALVPNFTHLLNEQARHLAYIVEQVRGQDCDTVEASQAAEDAWVGTIREMSKFGAEFFEACTPGYYNNEGKSAATNSLFNNVYAAGPVAFFDVLRGWRAQGDLEGLELG